MSRRSIRTRHLCLGAAVTRCRRAIYGAEPLESRHLLSAVLPDVHDTQVFLADDLESGISGWTVDNLGPDRVAGTTDDGLWHLSTRRSGDANHSGTHAFYYGREATGTYDTGHNTVGVLKSPAITLPQLAPNEALNISFKYYFDAPEVDPFGSGEFTLASFGVIDAKTSAPRGSNVPIEPGVFNVAEGFLEASADVSAYAGKTVRLAFIMDTSALPEASEGWYVDDLQVRRTRSSIWMNGQDAIHEIDAETGAVLRSVAYPEGEEPTTYGGGLSGLAYDGNFLYYTTPHYAPGFFGPREDPGQIFVIDPISGDVVNEIQPYEGDGVVDALAIDRATNTLYGFTISVYGTPYDFVRVDLATGEYATTPMPNVGTFALAADFDPATGHLFVAFDEGNATTGKSVIAEIASDATGDAAPQVLRTFEAPSTWVQGLAVNNGRLYVSDVLFDTIYELNVADGSVLRGFRAPRENPSGLGGSAAAQLFNNDVPALASDQRGRTLVREEVLSITAGDVDWFTLTQPAGVRLDVSAMLGDPDGNTQLSAGETLALEIWRDPLHDAAALASGTLNLATRTLTAAATFNASGKLYVKVMGASDAAQNTYALTLRALDRDEPNDTAATAKDLGSVVSVTRPELTAVDGEHDWYTFRAHDFAGGFSGTIELGDPDADRLLSATEIVSATLMIDTNGDNAPDTVVGQSRRNGRTVLINTVPAAAGQRFWLDVTGGTGAAYSLNIEYEDRFEPNTLGPAGVTTPLGGAVNVSHDPALHQSEMQIAVNPTNPDHLVIATTSLYLDAGFINRSYIDTYRSFDGGATWEQVRLQTRDNYLGDHLDPATDPVVAFDRFGNVYVSFHYHSSGGQADAFGVMARSTDDGATFTYTDIGPTEPGLDYNRMQFSIGPDAQDPTQENVYIAASGGNIGAEGSIYFWSSPAANAAGVLPLDFADRKVIGLTDDHDKQFASTAVGPEGQVYVAWWEAAGSSGSDGLIRFAADVDGLGAGGFGAVQDVDTTTLGYPTYVPWQPERGIGSVPFIGVDRSTGPARGAVYIGYVDIRPGSGYYSTTQFLLTWTANADDPAGATWADPYVVSSTSENASLGNIAIDQTNGQISALWYSTPIGSAFFSVYAEDYVTVQAARFFPFVEAPDYDWGDATAGYFEPTGARSSQAGRTPPGADFLLYNGIAAYGGETYLAWADNSTNRADLETFFTRTVTRSEQNATALNTLPGAPASGPIRDLTFSGVTIGNNDEDWYLFEADARGKITFDIAMRDLNGNGTLDLSEKLCAELYYKWDTTTSLGQYIDPNNSLSYSSTPDANGNFHLRGTFYNLYDNTEYVGDDARFYYLRVFGGPQPYDNFGGDGVTGGGATNIYAVTLHNPLTPVVTGDLGGQRVSDTIVLVRDPRNAKKLNVYINDPARATPAQVIDLSKTEDVFIFPDNSTGQEVDTIFFDFSNGPLAAPGFPTPRLYFGGGGYDDDFNNAVRDDVYFIGKDIDTKITAPMGGWEHNSDAEFTFKSPAAAGVKQTVRFLYSFGLSNVVDQTAGTLSYNAFDRAFDTLYWYWDETYFQPTVDATLEVKVIDSPRPGHGRLDVDSYSLYGTYDDDQQLTVEKFYNSYFGISHYDFTNKSSVRIDGTDHPTDYAQHWYNALSAPTDFYVDLASTPKGLQSLTLVGGEPDLFENTFNGSGRDKTIRVNAATRRIDGIAGTTVKVPVYVQQPGDINLAAGAATVLQLDDFTNATVTPDASDLAAGTIAAGAMNLNYAGFGPGSTLTFSATGGALELNGTAGNDTFAALTGNSISLNNALTLKLLGLRSLKLNGLDGDDAFRIAPALYSLTDVSVRGGEGNDQLVVNGTAADDRFDTTAQSIAVGNKTTRTDGVEQALIDGLGGNDLIAHTATAGVAEQLAVVGSTIAGAGTLSIASQTLLAWANAERVSVAGQSADGDTLTFRGTSAADTIQANLAANGTAADPVLQLRAGASSLLSLQDYTGFARLNLETLGGADTINVATAARSGFAGRKIFIDAGIGNDALNVTYTGKPASVAHNTQTRTVDLDFGVSRYQVQYLSVEAVGIKKQ